MSADGQEFVDQAEDMSVAEALLTMINAPLVAAGAGLAYLTNLFFTSLAQLFEAFEAARDFVVALLTSPITILETGAADTAAELSELGLAAFPAGVAIVAVGFLVWGILDPEIPFVDDLVPWR